MINLLSAEFGTISEAIRAHTEQEKQRCALNYGDGVTYDVALNVLMDQVASTLQLACVSAGDAIAICATEGAILSCRFECLLDHSAGG